MHGLDNNSSGYNSDSKLSLINKYKMKKILFLLFLLPLHSNAINNDSIAVEQLSERVSLIESREATTAKELKKVRNNTYALEQQMKKQTQAYQMKIDSLENAIISIKASAQESNERLGNDIKETQTQAVKNQEELNETIRSKSTIGVIALAVLLVAMVFVYLILRKRISTSSSSIATIKDAQDKIEAAQKHLKEEALKLDEKLVGLLDKQLEEQKEVPAINKKEEVDHSLAKKVADEIVRIELNLSRMDSSIKGHKQLSKAVERIKNNFLAQGYEIVDMLGKPYNEGMKVVANIVSDDTIEEGKQIITAIIKPQINYKGQMIQTAEITVSQNI